MSDKKQAIEENKAIQEGLESFLEQELTGFGDDINTTAGSPVSRELKTEFVTDASRGSAGAARGGKYSSNAEHSRNAELGRNAEYSGSTERGRGVNRADSNRTTASKNRAGYDNEAARDGEHSARSTEADEYGQSRKSGKKGASRNKKQGKKKKMPKWKKVLLILLIVILALLAWWYIMVGRVYNKMNHETSQELDLEPMKADGVTNILLIGNDSRENGEDGRSDAMILISISSKTKTIHMTSLLRDIYVDIPGHDGNRLNAAYAYGGPELLCQTIEQNFDIQVNRYVLVNFQAFAALVDAVGGIELEVTNEEVQWINAYLNEYNLLEGRDITTDYLDTSLSGEIHLNGPQALAYCRNRYIGTDFGRTERQRKVLSAVSKKLPLALATNSGSLINDLFPNLTTNLTQSEVFSLSLDANKLLSYEMVQMVIPADGTYSNATIRSMAVLQVDFDANKAILQKEIYGKE